MVVNADLTLAIADFGLARWLPPESDFSDRDGVRGENCVNSKDRSSPELVQGYSGSGAVTAPKIAGRDPSFSVAGANADGKPHPRGIPNVFYSIGGAALRGSSRSPPRARARGRSPRKMRKVTAIPASSTLGQSLGQANEWSLRPALQRQLTEQVTFPSSCLV